MRDANGNPFLYVITVVDTGGITYRSYTATVDDGARTWSSEAGSVRKALRRATRAARKQHRHERRRHTAVTGFA